MRNLSHNMPSRVLRTIGFLGRHAAASFAVILISGLLWTAAYFGLLLWAVLFGGGVGGPLAYPAGVLLTAMGAGASCCIILPAVVVSEAIARRRRTPLLSRILITTVIFSILWFSVAVTVRVFASTSLSLQQYWITAGVLYLALLPLLGIYWWIAQAASLLRSFIFSFQK